MKALVLYSIATVLAAGSTLGEMGGKPLIGVPEFENRTLGNAGGLPKVERGLPEHAGKIAADEVVALILQSGQFNVLSRSKLSLTKQGEEKKLALFQSGTEEMMKLCREMSAQYLLLGSISGFRVDEARGSAYGVQMQRITTRVTMDLQAINVATGEIAYQGAPTKSISISIPSGASTTEVYDWEAVLRQAVREAAEDLINGLAQGIGTSTEKLEKVKISVNSNPTGADIIVDNDFLGNTPSTIKIDEGRHIIRIEYQGHQLWERTINAFDGLVINPTLALIPAPAKTEKEKE